MFIYICLCANFDSKTIEGGVLKFDKRNPCDLCTEAQVHPSLFANCIHMLLQN